MCNIQTMFNELINAIRNGDFDAVQRLLLDEQLLACTSDNESECIPLHLAVQSGNMDIVNALLASSRFHEDVNRVDKSTGQSALHIVCASGNSASVEIAKVLIDHGALINVRDNNGDMPLHTACLSTPLSLNLMQLLIDNGADVHAKSSSTEHTPLLQLLCHRDDNIPVADACQLLLNNGADMEATCDNRDKIGLLGHIYEVTSDNARQLITYFVKKASRRARDQLKICEKPHDTSRAVSWTSAWTIWRHDNSAKRAHNAVR